MQYALNTHVSLEENIQNLLTVIRLNNPKNYRVRTFNLYTDIKNVLRQGERYPDGTSIFQPSRYFRTQDLPVAVFNKTIGDLKKVGIIGTTKGGEELFLSDVAWFDHCWKNKTEVVISLLEKLVDKGVFSSLQEFRDGCAIY